MKGECMERRSDLTYIFVHGLSGWGSYDKTYRSFPYWGTSGGEHKVRYMAGDASFQGRPHGLQGGMARRRNVRPFYKELLEMIDGLDQ